MKQPSRIFILSLLVRQPWAWVMGACALLQQLLSTTTLYCYSLSVQYFAEENLERAQPFFSLGLLVFLLSKGAALFTQLSAAYLFQKLYRSYCRFIFEKVFEDTSVLSKETKHSTLTLLSGEAILILKNLAVQVIPSLLKSTLNLGFTLFLVFQLFGEPLLLGLLAVFLFSFALFACFQKKLSHLAHCEQQSRIHYAHSFQKAWDLLFYGGERFKSSAYRSIDQEAMAFELHQRSSVLLEKLLSFLPLSFGVLCFTLKLYSYRDGEHPKGLLTFIALLPILLNLFDTLQEVVAGAGTWISLEVKCQKLFAFPNSWRKVPLNKPITASSLQLRAAGPASSLPVTLEQFLEALHAPEIKPGRWKLFGRNGAGKSSFLLKVKQLKPNAWLLAPGITLFPNHQEASTGERQWEQLKKLCAQPHPALLLLDEWDAHLDPKNREKVEQWLSKASKRHLILEAIQAKDSSA